MDAMLKIMNMIQSLVSHLDSDSLESQENLRCDDFLEKFHDVDIRLVISFVFRELIT